MVTPTQHIMELPIITPSHCPKLGILLSISKEHSEVDGICVRFLIQPMPTGEQRKSKLVYSIIILLVLGYLI